MKIGIYSPYIPKHMGGGEKYIFDVARVLAAEGHAVSVLIADRPGNHHLDLTDQKKKYEAFLDVSLSQVNFEVTPIGSEATFWGKLLATKKFDVLYYLTDGSLFFSLARKNILHLQVPFLDEKKSFIDRLKLMNWQVKNANSHFTQQVVQDHWRTPIPFVHYPMVDVQSQLVVQLHKEKIILHVGRFFQQLHAKRQDVLVEVFKEMILRFPDAMKEWKLHLVGSVEDPLYAEEIRKASEGYPIEVLHSLSRKELLDQYAKASLYWHATGFEVDEKNHPEKVEHFGISTVEAMSYGCVPIVIGKGGQKEILGEKLKHLLWDTTGECIEKSLEVIRSEAWRQELAVVSQQQSQRFSPDRFRDMLLKMIKS